MLLYDSLNVALCDFTICSCPGEEYHITYSPPAMISHSPCCGNFSPIGGTTNRVSAPTSGQTQKVLESMVSKECEYPEKREVQMISRVRS